MTFTALDKLHAARREVKFRRRVYFRPGGLVDRRRMSREKAELEVAVMEAIERDYEELAEEAKPCR